MKFLYPLARFSKPTRIILGIAPTIVLMLLYPHLPKFAYTTPGIIIFPLVLLTVWMGGFIPGILSMLSLSVYLVTQVWFDLFQSSDLISPAYVRAFLFLFSGTCFIILISALQRSLEQTKAALSLRDEFVSIASHELRTPMAALYLQMDVIKAMHKNDLPTIQAIELTKKHLHRLNRVITASLDLTMLDTGQIAINPTPCNLVQIVETSIESLKHQLNDTGTKVHFEATAPITGIWDSTRIEQVVVNLLQNAIKYGKGNPIKIKMEATHPEAIISIKDSGEGIAKAEAEIIFNRYQRGKNTSAIQGIGLGLYLSKSIVELHNGTIAVESRHGEGSTFIVKLPKLPDLSGAEIGKMKMKGREI
jgi:signal transduction histidine kinase